MLTILLILPVLLLLLGGGFGYSRRGRRGTQTGRGYLEKRPRPK